MREATFCTLFLLCLAHTSAQSPPASAQPAPAGWKVIKDGKGICQISVPPEWSLLDASTGAAILRDTTTAIAVVTSQPEQKFQPLTETLQRLLGVRKDKLFENTAKRVFYQDRVSANADEPHAFGASIPGTSGTCSCRVTVLPVVEEDTAKKIALSLAPAPPPQP